MKATVALLALAISVTGCTSTSPFASAKQREVEQVYIPCSVPEHTPTECIKRAEAECGAAGYEIVDRDGLPSSITNEDAHLRCKVSSGKAPGGVGT